MDNMNIKILHKINFSRMQKANKYSYFVLFVCILLIIGIIGTFAYYISTGDMDIKYILTLDKEFLLPLICCFLFPFILLFLVLNGIIYAHKNSKSFYTGELNYIEFYIDRLNISYVTKESNNYLEDIIYYRDIDKLILDKKQNKLIIEFTNKNNVIFNVLLNDTEDFISIREITEINNKFFIINNYNVINNVGTV